MRNVKNSYFRAILEVTNNGTLPEYSDLWRSYHPTALMLDSDYCLFTEPDRFEPTTSEEAITGQDSQKILYVPVRRKVSPRTWTKATNRTGKVSSKIRTISENLH
ncbi:hypothetical protein [Nitrosomonas ureae]|uniref:Uncharacterized protein n=1 Tax=Nitrosomonas ureae TaxID=44577 RepID=A0A286ACB8_9PROT|nr:hypothetical protein [Nitrosomonas ureae]SOD19541.1 hypothetical protein SAMN06297164_2546 [Nitrosomonas ureae]